MDWNWVTFIATNCTSCQQAVQWNLNQIVRLALRLSTTRILSMAPEY